MKLIAQGITKKYGDRQVVSNVSVECQAGQIVGLLGPNGAGKTTTFYAIVGEIQPDQGKIFLDHNDISQLPMYERARLGLGYLPQETSVFRNLTVYENIMVALEARHEITDRERHEKALILIEEFGLKKVFKSPAYTLSGGERRRTEIARACALEPKFFLLDEPFAGIDPLAIEDVQTVVKYLKHKGLGIIITDHNVRETLKICDWAYVLVDGMVISAGTNDQIVADEKVRRYYLGQSFSLR
ncbi:MAG: LPS export ABC transporter ATP-binding protein [Deltaproteobacteria bacterium]|nr:LPS export ABC transporter ATP-binding protein [Deltaproteobacteria bacterium]MCX7953342.1 LPS export ABC transporter ATP-binding protein [Deltaproteobacteria bacterium]